MTIYADTSAFYAILDAADESHERAGRTWIELIEQDKHIVTSNYVLLETCALVRNRLGVEAVRRFVDEVMPALDVVWVDENLHNAGLTATFVAGRKGPSLVDCVSFASMRHLRITDAFALDKHFVDQGFFCKP